jgi:hypothetical protein
MAILGLEIGKDMLEAMGINADRVVSFQIDVKVDEVVTISLTRLLDESELKGFVGFMNRLRGRTTKTEVVNLDV